MGAGKEENGGGCGTTAPASEGRIRIYIGGLGGSVSADDLKKTFSTPQLGNVDSVEIVRTKGRSIAYLDFIPVSDKGLAKLFSTYNGCMWKGGRLRLEKAKEHYLLRLKREWAEDAALSSDSVDHDVSAFENPHSSEKLSKVCNSEMQIRIFFPKLRKVKPLPFKGTGKHKYSFQHIVVPSLPTHFCDCEEHSVPSEPGKREPSTNEEKEIGGMDNEELNMMNSIMSKIFQRESCSETTSRIDEFATEAYNNTSLNDDLQFDDALADQGSDEDNLIINVVAGSKPNGKIPLSNIRGTRTVAGNKDIQGSKTRPVERMPKNQGKMSSNKKRKAPHDEDSHTNDILSVAAVKKAKTHNPSDDLEIVPDTQSSAPRSDIPQSRYNPVRSQKSAFRDLVSDRDSAIFRISDICHKAEAASKPDSSNVQCIVTEENQKTEPSRSKKENGNAELVSDAQCVVEEENQQTEPCRPKKENGSAELVSHVPNAEMNKSAKNTSWLQKSSWMQLVGGSTDSSFSISQILPGLNVEHQEVQLLKGAESSVPLIGNHHNFMKTDENVSKPLIKEKKVFPGLDGGDQSDPVKKLQGDGDGNEASTSSPVSKKHLSRPKKTSVAGTGTSETFTFMRSSASMKEWMKTKAALSGSLKKKRNEK
ncbi:hypothetical protein M9H77_27869 [Catharanthus roseus]|uniref:Uncharacterized protein n=1 Tax=Catharanthus roseus TaxID=4058 RepID=A0ACC0AER1_CATRO|nr:hypothetical protein M9H77_27869 [Catharanthus roseus]